MSAIVTHHQTCECSNDIDSHYLDERTIFDQKKNDWVKVKFRGACLCANCPCTKYVQKVSR